MRLSVAVISLILPAALAACSESTGPETPFAVVVSLVSTSGPTFVDADTVAKLQCEVTFRAVAEGHGTATWGAAEYYFYFGPDRSAPLDSGVLAATAIHEAWGTTTIDSTHVEQSSWRLTAGIPFDVAFAFDYRKPNGEQARTAPVKFNCGPAIPPGSSPPTLTSLDASALSGQIQSGDTFTVSYSLTSDIGLWESAVAITGTGPCNISRVFPEHLTHQSTHAVKIVIPAGCVLGSSLEVRFRAFDAAGQGIQTRVATLTFVDHTRPRSSIYFNWLYQSPLGSYALGGDPLVVSVFASDNNALSAVFWQLQPGGAIDSTPTNLQSYGRGYTVPVGDSSPSKLLLRAWSRDLAGLVSDTAVGPPDSVRVIPTRHHPMRTSGVVPQIGAMTLVEPRGEVYALIANPPEILGVALQSLAVIDTIRLPATPGDMDVTASGDSLVVTLPDSRAVAIVDLTTSPPSLTLMTLPSLAAANVPARVRTLANGVAFIATSGTPATQALLELNLRTGIDRVRTDAGVNGTVGAVLERSSDHRVVAVDIRTSPARLQRYDLASDAFGTGFYHDGWFEPAVDGTGAHIALGTTVIDAGLNLVRAGESPAVGQGLFPVALSYNGATLFHTMYPFGVLRDSVATGQLLERTRLSFFAPYFVRESSDGTMLILYDSQNSRVVVMDPR